MGTPDPSITPRDTIAPDAHRSFSARVLFPAALFLAATLFLFGDIGKWNDDYYFWGQFHADTGQVRSWILDRPVHFWRPVYRWIATPLNVLLWDHDAINHTLTAVIHGLTCIILYRFMRRLRLSAHAALAATLLFMLHPAHFEVVFWNTCMFTGLGTAIILLTLGLYLSFVQGRLWASPLQGWWAVPLLAAATFTVAGMNEQPAAAVLATPLLALLAAHWARQQSGDARSLRPLVLRAAIASAACIGAMLAYAFIHTSMFPPNYGDGLGAVIPAAHLPARVARLARDIGSSLTFRGLGGGALNYGVLSLREHPVTAAITALILAILGVHWIRWFSYSRPQDSTPAERRSAWIPAHDPLTLLLIMAFGIALFVALWMPIARLIYLSSPRLHYAPNCGLAIALAAAADLCTLPNRSRADRGRAFRLVAAVALFAGFCTLTLMMIGVQRGYQARSTADLADARALRAAIPDPEPRSILLPLRYSHRPIRTGSWMFDHYFSPPLANAWAGGWYVQWVFRRSDIFTSLSARLPRTPESALVPVDTQRLRFLGELSRPLRRWDDPSLLLRWDRVIPLEVDRSGHITLIDQVEFAGESTTLSVRLRQTQRALDAGSPAQTRRLQLDARPAADAPTTADDDPAQGSIAAPPD